TPDQRFIGKDPARVDVDNWLEGHLQVERKGLGVAASDAADQRVVGVGENSERYMRHPESGSRETAPAARPRAKSLDFATFRRPTGSASASQQHRLPLNSGPTQASA